MLNYILIFLSKEISFFTKKGDLDLSEYMSQAYGFLPVPIIITEPSVGYGDGDNFAFNMYFDGFLFYQSNKL